MPSRSVTIFVSSPGDVARERRYVVEAVERLRHEFAAHFDVEAILWEDRPLSAAGSFQAQIVEPAKTDIVVLILWWRLGTPLQHRDGWDRDFTGPLSGAEVTGTEWEFENALRAAQATPGQPFIIVFQKEGVPSFASDDEAFAYEREKSRVIGFFDRWFRDGAAYVRAFRTFSTEAEFADLIDDQLEALLLERVEVGDRRRGLVGEEPYRGLEAFDLASAPVFFGRTRVRQQLRDFAEARAQSGTPWVLVTGASGSGKSSLVIAGLLADARRPGVIDGIGECRYMVVRPTDPDGEGEPARALARGLLAEQALPELGRLQYDAARLERVLASGRDATTLAVDQAFHEVSATMPGHVRPMLMVIVDQMEEVFRLPPERREAFVRALVAIAAASDVWVVATLRSDSLDDLDAHHELASCFDAEGRFLLSAPSDVEYAQIIQRPARAAGCRFEVDPTDGQSLDEVLLAEVRAERSSLPLLEHLLEQLWQRRTDDGLLTFAAHRALGGLTGAIAKSADEVLDSVEVTADLRRTLVSMARLDDDGKWVKEKVRWDDVPLTVRDVFERLVARRLLVAGDDGAQRTVEVAHEQLFASWRRLAEWLRQSADDHRLHRELRLVAQSWVERGRDIEPLLGGTRLARALELRDRGQLRVDPDVRAFIDASEAEATREQRELDLARKRRLRRYAMTAGALGALAAAMTAAALIAVVQWRNAQRNADETKAVELASVAGQLTDQSLDRALLLAVESYHRRPVPEAEASLVTTLARLPGLQHALRGHTDEVRAVAVSPDGEVVASAGRDHTIVLWRPDGSTIRVIDGHGDEVHGLAFDSSGTVLVSSSDDGTIRRWDTGTGGQIGSSSTGHVGAIRGIAIDPDDRWIASAGHDSSVRIWDLATGAEITRLDDHDGFALDVAFSADGGLLASTGMDGMVVIHRTTDFGEEARFSVGGGPARAIAFRPGRTSEFAVAGEDGRVTVWELGRDGPIVEYAEHAERVFDVAYSSDGASLASGARDQRVVVRDVSTEGVVEVLDGHAGDVRALAFLPSGRLVSGGRDRTVLLWDLTLGQRLAQRPQGEASVDAVAYSDDGSRLSTVGDGGARAVLVETTGDERQEVALEIDAAVVGYVAGGSEVIIGHRDGSVSFVAAGTLDAIEHPTAAHGSEVTALAIAPGGTRAATSDSRGHLVLWDVGRHAQEAEASLTQFGVADAAFATGGGPLFVVDGNGSLWSWSLEPGAELTEVADNRVRARSLAVSPDGRLLAVGTSQDQLQLYRLERGTPSLASVVDHAGEIDAVAVGDNGRVAAASTEAGTVTMWDGESSRSLGSFTVDAPRGVALRSGTSTVAVATPAGLEVWDLDVDRMIAIACDVANRNLTLDEWDFYVGGHQRSTCPDEPAPSAGS